MPKSAHAMVLKDEWLPEAREDLNAELEYDFSEFGVQAAENVYRKIVEYIDNLLFFQTLESNGATLFTKEMKFGY